MAINSSRLKITVRESITLNDNKYDSFITHNIDGINEISKRIITVAGDNQLHNIIQVSGSIGPGAFLTDDVKYMRFTNLSTDNPIMLTLKNEDSDSFVTKIGQGLSFIYSGASGSGVVDTMDADSSNIDITAGAYAGLGDLTSVVAKASGSAAEYAGSTSGSVYNVDMEIFVAAI